MRYSCHFGAGLEKNDRKLLILSMAGWKFPKIDRKSQWAQRRCICKYIFRMIHVFIYLIIYLFIYLFVYLFSIYLVIRLFISLFFIYSFLFIFHKIYTVYIYICVCETLLRYLTVSHKSRAPNSTERSLPHACETLLRCLAASLCLHSCVEVW